MLRSILTGVFFLFVALNFAACGQDTYSGNLPGQEWVCSDDNDCGDLKMYCLFKEQVVQGVTLKGLCQPGCIAGIQSQNSAEFYDSCTRQGNLEFACYQGDCALISDLPDDWEQSRDGALSGTDGDASDDGSSSDGDGTPSSDHPSSQYDQPTYDTGTKEKVECLYDDSIISATFRWQWVDSYSGYQTKVARVDSDGWVEMWIDLGQVFADNFFLIATGEEGEDSAIRPVECYIDGVDVTTYIYKMDSIRGWGFKDPDAAN